MTPFREECKYDIIKKREIIVGEDMPLCFLADSIEEAEKIYKKFEQLLNNISFSYSVSTGIDRDDLFREALIGLARAYRDWGHREYSFSTYAVYRIKEALNEYVAHNATIIKVPTYIRRCQSNINKIMAVCSANALSWQDVIYLDTLPVDIDKETSSKLYLYKDNIKSAAKRHGIDYIAFVKRVMMIPVIIEIEDKHVTSGDYEDIKELVADIMEVLPKQDKEICELIMQGNSYAEIAEHISRSESWVNKRIASIRKFLTKKGN